jgi:S1-C subfamily serine protease
MARRLLTIFLCFYMSLAVSAATAQQGAQQSVWVQIESHPTQAEARARAQDYGTLVPDLNGFALRSGWYTLALGPFDAGTAEATLRALRGNGLVPRDSFIADGRGYGAPFWPEGGQQQAQIAPLIVPTPQVEAPQAPLPLGETLSEARAAESRLTRAERETLQAALQWFGFYTSTIDGAFGPGTRRAMQDWQNAQGVETTGVLSTVQRATLLGQYQTALATLGLEAITDTAAGISIEAPMGLVAFDRYEAPFAHYEARDGSGVRMILISQTGDQGTMDGLYQILQTLDVVPPTGPRSKARDGFSLRGESPTITSETRVRLRDGHIHGFMLIWPPEQAANIGRVLPQMESSLRSVGPAMNPGEGYDTARQDIDLVSGLEIRRPIKSRSGFFVDRNGRVLTSAELAQGCGRLTINQLHDVQVVYSDETVALLAPRETLAPVAVASFARAPGRLRSPVSVAGFPYEGILGAATLTFGTLEDLRGLTGDEALLRLGLTAQPGDTGGPVFDETGAVTGVLLPATSPNRALPADVAFARKSTDLMAALLSQGLTPTMSEATAAIALEDLTTLAADMTVLVSCWEQ